MGSTGIARGDKHTTLEGGVRIPFIVRWPGHVPANAESACTTSHVDLLPTLLQLAGVPAPQPIDGVSVANVWLGQSAPDSCSNRKPMFWAAGRESPCLVASNGRHKLWLGKCATGGAGGLGLNHTAVAPSRADVKALGPTSWLFDLLDDPTEMRPLPLSGAARDVERRLRAQLLAWMCEHCGSRNWKGIVTAREGLGEAAFKCAPGVRWAPSSDGR